jgi:hypothetical protein
MQHAFLITAYKDVPALERMVGHLGPHALVYIHLDRRSRVPRAQVDALRALPTVRLLSRRHRVNWGSTAHLRAILLLAQAAVKDGQAEYLHLISGSDHPLLHHARFDVWMEAQRGNEFLEHFPLPTTYWREGGLDRLLRYHPLDLIDIRKPRRKALIDLLMRLQARLGISRSLKGLPPLHGGSTWWSMSRACVAHVLDRLARQPQLMARFAHTRCGEEILFQTLVLDSPFAGRVVNDNLRYIDWHTRNGSTPAVLDITDQERLPTSGKLFARKLESPVSDELIAALQQDLAAPER